MEFIRFKILFKNKQDILKNAFNALEALDIRLGTDDYFNSTPGLLDATVFGFISVILDNELLSDLATATSSSLKQHKDRLAKLIV